MVAARVTAQVELESYSALLRRVSSLEQSNPNTTERPPEAALSALTERYAYHRLQIEQRTDPTRDSNTIDLEIARRLYRERLSPEEIALALVSASPALSSGGESAHIRAHELASQASPPPRTERGTTRFEGPER